MPTAVESGVAATMKNRKTEPPRGHKKPTGKAGKPDAAFDVWLERGLHNLFDGIASEPIPEELLRILNEDRKK